MKERGREGRREGGREGRETLGQLRMLVPYLLVPTGYFSTHPRGGGEGGTCCQILLLCLTAFNKRSVAQLAMWRCIPQPAPSVLQFQPVSPSLSGHSGRALRPLLILRRAGGAGSLGPSSWD